jgi:hypothetical protein
MGGREGGVGGPGYGPSFQAETIMIQNCPPEHERLEQSNVRIAHARARRAPELNADISVPGRSASTPKCASYGLSFYLAFPQYLVGTPADVRVHYSPFPIAHSLRYKH